jgi:hypothetical protein
MEYLIYRLDSPEVMLKNIEGEEETLNEDEALLFPIKEDALTIIDSLSGGSDFWGTRKPRPRNN